MGSGSSPASPKPPSKGYYICNGDPTHKISWEVWHINMSFPVGEGPGRCGVCSGNTFVFHPNEGIPPAEAIRSFEPPDMEDFIHGILD